MHYIVCLVLFLFCPIPLMSVIISWNNPISLSYRTMYCLKVVLKFQTKHKNMSVTVTVLRKLLNMSLGASGRRVFCWFGLLVVWVIVTAPLNSLQETDCYILKKGIYPSLSTLLFVFKMFVSILIMMESHSVAPKTWQDTKFCIGLLDYSTRWHIFCIHHNGLNTLSWLWS